MKPRLIHLAQDMVYIIVSVAVAIFLVRSGAVHDAVISLGGLSYAGVFVAGMFFTSIFTSLPATAILVQFSTEIPLPTVALLGGVGAVVGDFVIFLFIKDRIAKDIEFLIQFSRNSRRLVAIFKNRFFHYLIPLFGMIIIASPLPDEIGITMLGLSRVSSKYFFITSFVLNSVGIFILGWLVRAVVV